MKNLLQKSVMVLLVLCTVNCSKENNSKLSELEEALRGIVSTGLVYLTIDGEEINFNDGGIMASNFNIGNPPGFIIQATASQKVFPVPFLRIFIREVTEDDLIAGAVFSGEDQLKMEYVLYNEEDALSPAVFSAYTEEDVYLKITEVDLEDKTISGVYNFIGLDSEDGWYEGGKTYTMEGSFEGMSYK